MVPSITPTTYYWPLTITVTNPCATAIITASSDLTLSYVIGDPTPTTGAIGFTVSPSICALSYTYKFSNSTTVGTNPLFTFPDIATLQVGASSNNNYASTTAYVINVKASVTYGAATATQAFTVTVHDQCFPTTVTINTGSSYTYTILDPLATYTMDPFIVV